MSKREKQRFFTQEKKNNTPGRHYLKCALIESNVSDLPVANPNMLVSCLKKLKIKTKTQPGGFLPHFF